MQYDVYTINSTNNSKTLSKLFEKRSYAVNYFNQLMSKTSDSIYLLDKKRKQIIYFRK